jgi:hypothetical protein
MPAARVEASNSLQTTTSRKLTFDIAGTVASLTERELDVQSEKASNDILGQPGKQYEVGKLFGC